MLKHLLSVAAIWTVVVACFAFSDAPVSGTSGIATPSASVARFPRATPHMPLDLSVDLQMQALERRARVEMLLYTGSFGQHAENTQLPAVAFNLRVSAE
jgi:hypothetical protein